MGQKNINGDLNIIGAIKHNGTEISYNGVNRIETTDITELTQAQCESLKVGDVIVENDNGEYLYYAVDEIEADEIFILDFKGMSNGYYGTHIYKKISNVWSYDIYETTSFYDDGDNLKVYTFSQSDIADMTGTVYTFTDEFKDIVTSGRYILIINAALIDPSNTNDCYFIPHIITSTVYSFVCSDAELPILSGINFYIDEQDYKLKLDRRLNEGLFYRRLQEDLEENQPSSGTLDTVLGYDTWGGLVKGTVSGGGGMQNPMTAAAIW